MGSKNFFEINIEKKKDYLQNEHRSIKSYI